MMHPDGVWIISVGACGRRAKLVVVVAGDFSIMSVAAGVAEEGLRQRKPPLL